VTDKVVESNVSYAKLKKYKKNSKMFIISSIKKNIEIRGSLDQEAEKYKVILDISNFQDQTV
jgi:hypothetical protein